MSKYQSWLERQNELAQKALELIQKHKFRAVLIADEKKLPFVRLYIANKHVDFHIKEVKTKFVKTVWLCKKEDFSPKNNYLVVFKTKDGKERWLITTGSQAELKGEYRNSDYHKGTKFLVVPMEIFRSATSFFKSAKRRYEEQLQRRMTEWV